MHSSHSRVRRIAYTASSGLGGNEGVDSCGSRLDFGRTCPLQLGGHRIIETFWVAQSTSGLWRVSQECPMITICCLRFVTARGALSECCPNDSVIWHSSITDP